MAIEDKLLLEARKIALERGTTVDQIVRDHLATLVSSDRRLRQERSNLKKAFATGIVEVGKRTWRRSDLYER